MLNFQEILGGGGGQKILEFLWFVSSCLWAESVVPFLSCVKKTSSMLDKTRENSTYTLNNELNRARF